MGKALTADPLDLGPAAALYDLLLERGDDRVPAMKKFLKAQARTRRLVTHIKSHSDVSKNGKRRAKRRVRGLTDTLSYLF